MAKQNLLLVDADPRSLRVLEVSLRKAGYSVAACSDATSATEMMELSQPDLILSDTRLPGSDGFQFVEEIRKHKDWAEIPFMFLSSDLSVESKVRGLELGVEDYLTKPIYIKEIITRVNLVLQRKQREGLELKEASEKTRFTGSLADMGLVDLLQTIDISKKSGVLYISSGKTRGAIYFQDGHVIDAELGHLRGERAIYRALVWSDGSFEIDFRPVRRDATVQMSTQAILMEGMRRVDEWGRLLEQLPSLDSVFEVNEEELLERLAEIPDEINDVLKHFDGSKPLMAVVDAAGKDDLETLTAISKLYFEGLIFDTGRRGSMPPESVGSSIPPAAAAEETADTSFESEMVPGRSPSPPPAYAEAGEALEARSYSDPGLVGRQSQAPAPTHREAAGDAMARAAADYRDGEDARLRRNTADGVGPQEASEASDNIIRFPARPGEEEGTTDDAHSQAWRSDTSERNSLASRAGRRGKRRKKRLKSSTAGSLRAPSEADWASSQSEPPAAADEPTAKQGVVQKTPGSGGAKRTLVGVPDLAQQYLQDKARAYEEPRPAGPAPTPRPPAREPEPEEPPLAAREPEPEEPPLAAREPEPEEQPPAARDSSEDLTHALQTLPPSARPPATPGFPDPSQASSTPSRPAREQEPAASSQPLPLQTSPYAAEEEAAPDEHHEDATAERFFSSPPSHPPDEAHDDVDDVPGVPMSQGARRGMLATAALLALALIGYGAWHFYSTQVMPAPAELGGPAPNPELPRPTKPEDTPATSAKEPEQGGKPGEGKPGETKAEPDETTASAGESTTQTDEAQRAQAAGEDEPPTEPASPEKASGSSGDYEALLAKAKRARGRRALELYRQAVDVNPQGAAALGKLAFHFLNRGDNRRAAEYAQRAVDADPTSSQGWIVLGAARHAMGNVSGARDAYRSCVQQGEGRYVVECRRMLR